MSELGQEHARTRTSGLAIASLALGVIGFLAVPLIASALAIALGRSAEREIARDPSLGGEGLARAGVILGWIGLALVGGALLLGLLLFAAV